MLRLTIKVVAIAVVLVLVLFGAMLPEPAGAGLFFELCLTHDRI